MAKKLVRDNIPKIIKEATGNIPKYKVADKSEAPEWLTKKIIEEALEAKKAIKSGNAAEIDKELADIKSAFDGLILALGRRPQNIQKIQTKRDAVRGTFTRRIIIDFPKKRG